MKGPLTAAAPSSNTLRPMKARGSLAVLLWAVALMALPVAAPAKPGYYVDPANRSATLNLSGTNGYSIYISGSERSVLVLATKRKTSVSYFVFREGLKGDRLRGRLPGIGWIQLRFNELSRSQLPYEDGCRGPATLVRRGVFEGSIRIRGESGYTRVEKRRAFGKIVQEPRTTCRERAAAMTSRAETQTLTAETSRGEGYLRLIAYRVPWIEFDALYVNASLLRERGRMAIINSSYAVTRDPGKLAIARPPRSATLTPPRPFTGMAAFAQESQKDFNWTGDLAVELPGIGEVGLAGPGWKSGLCVGRNCRGDAEGGNPTSIATVFSQGSGSHSQPLALARLSSLR
jgi:hypothetical protein